MKNPIHQWNLDLINDIILACITMHNMKIEDKGGMELEVVFDQLVSARQLQGDFSFCELEGGTKKIVESSKHLFLRNDIINHLWKLRGEGRFESFICCL